MKKLRDTVIAQQLGDRAAKLRLMVVIVIFIVLTVDAISYANRDLWVLVTCNGVLVNVFLIVLVLMGFKVLSSNLGFAICVLSCFVNITFCNYYFFSIDVDDSVVFFFRDNISFILLIACIGYLSDVKFLFIGTILYVFYILVVGLSSNSSFVYENIPFLLIVAIGFCILIYSLVKVLDEVIEKLEVKNKDLELSKEKSNEALNTIENQNHLLEFNIKCVGNLKASILPRQEMLRNNFQDHVLKNPLGDTELLNDFYFLERRDQDLYIGIASCEGQGISGAFVAMIANQVIKNVLQPELTVADAMFRINHALIQELKSDFSSMSLFEGMKIGVCRFNLKTNEVSFAGAMRNFLVQTKDSVQLYEGKDQFLGLDYWAPHQQYHDFSIQLTPGDTFTLFHQIKEGVKAEEVKTQFGKNEGLDLMKQAGELNGMIKNPSSPIIMVQV